MADAMVLEFQQYLNGKYSGQSGYDDVPENGQTGWLTIYGAIEGLQIELGIATPAPNFGDGTKVAYDAQVTPNWGSSLPSAIVYLIQGAFWCKGISPNAFNGIYSNDLDVAVEVLKYNAGFTAPNGVLTGEWAKALFDMSAFTLVAGGDANIRTMQQWMNANYLAYTGIMPCDGVYQRDTNTALIQILQANEGLTPDQATGTYGPTTDSLTPTLNIGATGDFVKIVQFGLYVNGFNTNAVMDGVYSSYIGSEVEAFREFMILPTYSTTADLTVIKGLLTSNGNVNRWATGGDTANQLSIAMVNTLVDNGVTTIGRYLTGTVGNNFVDKSLSVAELNRLFDSGIAVFPIYQDGGANVNYFNFYQGIKDANLAGHAAYDLGIPLGTEIYFAVDVDALGGDIAGTVIPYFRIINYVMSQYNYKVGVYGTRNVCNQVITDGSAVHAFVSDMSSGYSGNLGYAMPRQWAFDQIVEFGLGSGSGYLDFDNDAVSGRDAGFNSLQNIPQRPSINDLVTQIKAIEDYIGYDGSVADKKKICDFYRQYEYTGPFWDLTSGEIDTTLMVNLIQNFGEPIASYTDIFSGNTVGTSHLFATLGSYYGPYSSVNSLITDYCGWFGDLFQLWKTVDPLVSGSNAETLVYDFIGSNDGNFDGNDLRGDTDAVIIMNNLENGMDFSAAVFIQVTSSLASRVDKFIDIRFNGNSSTIADEVLNIFGNQFTISDFDNVAFSVFFANNFGIPLTYLLHYSDLGNGLEAKLKSFV